MPPGRAYLRVMVAADRGERRRRFPALDPEPPPRSWRRRALLPLAVVLLAATAWAAAQAWPSSPRPVRGRAAGRQLPRDDGRPADHDERWQAGDGHHRAVQRVAAVVAREPVRRPRPGHR